MDENQYDETYVRPVLKPLVPDTDELIHVGLRWCTVKGTVRPGCVELFLYKYRFPATFLRGELCDLEPRVVGVQAWKAQLEEVFGEPFAQIFPLRWELAVAHANRRRSGRGLLTLTQSNSCQFTEDDA